MGVIAIISEFFFCNLYNIRDIRQAFNKICLNKMLVDGYFDMSIYIYARLKKDDIYASLIAIKSKYTVLYQMAYPDKEEAYSEWCKKIEEAPSTDNISPKELTKDEAKAIVNWIYRTMKNAQEREAFTEELFQYIKEVSSIKNNIKFSRGKGVVYNAEKVDLHFLSSVSEIGALVSNLNKGNKMMFFRGHADPNYILQPSILRTSRLRKNESRLYHEILINCPDEFEKCYTHLEKLVKMQHYGLPTRLLDITRNLLVALYFACESHLETYGELVLLSTENHNIKYPQSDIVSLLASLPVFSYNEQQELFCLASDSNVSDLDFNKSAGRLIQEIQLEKPAFQAEVKKNDILNSCIVFALKNNERIVKQDGAFILCGLSDDVGFLEKFRYKEHGKKVVIIIEKKKEILEQLESYSINRASLFPEIECVAEYLREKYTC